MNITRIDPRAAIPGGEIAIHLSGAGPETEGRAHVLVDRAEAHVVAASKNRMLALLPWIDHGGEVEVSVNFGDEGPRLPNTVPFVAGKRLVDSVHPVANPAFDPADGSLFVTRSGSRGEHVSVSLYRIDADDKIEEFSGDISNPTAIAFDKRGQMFVT